jgi:hypothetical protein
MEDSANGSAYGFEPRDSGFTPMRVLALFGLLSIFAFWTWALFFATKASINKIEDRDWAARTEAICADTKTQLTALEEQESADINVRAALVIESTNLMAQMLDSIESVQPDDAKGQAIVPDWISEYRILLENRYTYADRLLAGNDGPFTETALGGVPVTERLEAFARDNEMSSCEPPRGSVV